MKRFLRAGLLVICVAGVTLAVWPLGQQAYAWWNQRELRKAWSKTPAKVHGSARVSGAKLSAPALAAKSSAQASKITPWPLTRLIIPSIDLDVVVVQSWSEKSLRRGPGHWAVSAGPGQPGNCVIAAHRNVYGSYFNRVDELWAGSVIQLRTPEQTFTYKTILVRTVPDTDTSVLASSTDPQARPMLTLVTCTVPRTSNRVVVLAQMSDENY